MVDPLTLTLVASLAGPPSMALTPPRLEPSAMRAWTPMHVAPATGLEPEEEEDGPFSHLGAVTIGLLGMQAVTLYGLSYLPADATGWGEGSFSDIPRNDMRGPKWDTDAWGWNYVAHPIVGSEYYLLARNRALPWWGSLLYSVGMSTFWEFFTEAYYERPSGQDLLITPLAGSVLGELRWQAKQALREPAGAPRHAWKTVLRVVLDPVDAISDAF